MVNNWRIVNMAELVGVPGAFALYDLTNDSFLCLGSNAHWETEAAFVADIEAVIAEVEESHSVRLCALRDFALSLLRAWRMNGAVGQFWAIPDDGGLLCCES